MARELIPGLTRRDDNVLCGTPTEAGILRNGQWTPFAGAELVVYPNNAQKRGKMDPLEEAVSALRMIAKVCKEVDNPWPAAVAQETLDRIARAEGENNE